MSLDVLVTMITVGVFVYVGYLVLAFCLGPGRRLLAGLGIGQEKHNQALYEQWQAMKAAARASNTELFQVRRVYQRAKNGDKAYVVSLRSGDEYDSWFEKMRVGAGAFVLVESPTFGRGTQSNNSKVLYVRAGQVRGQLPSGTRRAVDRHESRLQRQSVR
ncbi:hypothetical protein [Actinophytocola sp. KF-1]